MDLFDVIKNRRSIRDYQNKKVPRYIVEKILEAGVWAPSAHNLQPWKFVIVDNDKKISYIADLLEKKAEELFSGFNIVLRDTAKNLKNAPILFVIYGNKIISKKFDRLGTRYSEIGNIFETQSVANAIENMLLCIHDLGLGAAWCGMALFCEEEINYYLRQKGKLLAVISLGYPRENATSSNRKEISEVSEFIV